MSASRPLQLENAVPHNDDDDRTMSVSAVPSELDGDRRSSKRTPTAGGDWAALFEIIDGSAATMTTTAMAAAAASPLEHELEQRSVVSFSFPISEGCQEDPP